jgi:hypothetical protein
LSYSSQIEQTPITPIPQWPESHRTEKKKSPNGYIRPTTEKHEEAEDKRRGVLLIYSSRGHNLGPSKLLL